MSKPGRSVATSALSASIQWNTRVWELGHDAVPKQAGALKALWNTVSVPLLVMSSPALSDLKGVMARTRTLSETVSKAAGLLSLRCPLESSGGAPIRITR